ncbi:tyrosine--tRNA ligase [Candidatus Woesearchaeota archaeon]|nr:tyrosine--tRNA ligase [Candidatus Woesearchaeota archaeon]
MDITTRINLIKEVGEEILTEDDLRALLEAKQKPLAYDGFEPSGRIHIAQGLMRAINVNKMLKAGCKFMMWVADWHALANNKMGGDIDKIRTTGEYFIEVWKACGMDTETVKFVWCNDIVSDPAYWMKVLQVARSATIQRLVRCSQIMGRKDSDALSGAQLMYPCMQAADMFHMNVDIAQLGMDQRKVNVLARELGPSLGYGKVVAVHHHMLMGLLPPAKDAVAESIERSVALKMSKSVPDASIFMDDSPEEIARKIQQAYCPANSAHENPVMEYCKYIIFPRVGALTVKRPLKYGGPLEFSDFAGLQKAFEKGDVHPMDLKSAVAEEINNLVDPVRRHFEKGKARKLLDQVNSFKVTR